MALSVLGCRLMHSSLQSVTAWAAAAAANGAAAVFFGGGEGRGWLLDRSRSAGSGPRGGRRASLDPLWTLFRCCAVALMPDHLPRYHPSACPPAFSRAICPACSMPRYAFNDSRQLLRYQHFLAGSTGRDPSSSGTSAAGRQAPAGWREANGKLEREGDDGGAGWAVTATLLWMLTSRWGNSHFSR